MEPALATIERVLRPFEAVTVAYLFGSVLSGRMHGESDLDLAVLFRRSLLPDERDRTKLAIIDALARALGPLGERTDLVDFDEASAAVAFKAIQGKCVLSRDERERVGLEVRVARRYDDEAPTRALYRRAAKRRFGAP